MMIDPLPPGLNRIREGKVRSVFEITPDQILIVTSDRVSAFDVVLPSRIPGKGILLTQLSNYWFAKLADICPNHLLATEFSRFPKSLMKYRDDLIGRSVLARKVDIIPYECIVRGYISGSMWKAYRRGELPEDIRLPAGLKESDRLPEPLFTPTTKAESGHDLPVTLTRMADDIGTETATVLRTRSLEIYRRASVMAEERGIMIADTKFEFGFTDGRIVLADEVLTPDSSRFWPRSDYLPGRPQTSFDKQFIRDWLETLDWDKTPPAPDLPDDIIRGTMQRYLDAYRLLTGQLPPVAPDGTWRLP